MHKKRKKRPTITTYSNGEKFNKTNKRNEQARNLARSKDDENNDDDVDDAGRRTKSSRMQEIICPARQQTPHFKHEKYYALSLTTCVYISFSPLVVNLSVKGFCWFILYIFWFRIVLVWFRWGQGLSIQMKIDYHARNFNIECFLTENLVYVMHCSSHFLYIENHNKVLKTPNSDRHTKMHTSLSVKIFRFFFLLGHDSMRDIWLRSTYVVRAITKWRIWWKGCKFFW